ncbi:cupin domain-containing protein [Paenibacillus solani]|nr:cupin domain-containing protein [Paenibacillus solani]
MTKHISNPRKQAEGKASHGAAAVSSQELPLLQGMYMSEIHLGRGEGLSPHGHPDCDELCYVIQGEISYSLIDPGDQRVRLILAESGQVLHAPAGWCHWLTSLTSNTILLLIYSAQHPQQMDIGPAWSYSLQEAKIPQKEVSSKQTHTYGNHNLAPQDKEWMPTASEPSHPEPPWLNTMRQNNKTTRGQ